MIRYAGQSRLPMATSTSRYPKGAGNDHDQPYLRNDVPQPRAWDDGPGSHTSVKAGGPSVRWRLRQDDDGLGSAGLSHRDCRGR